MGFSGNDAQHPACSHFRKRQVIYNVCTIKIVLQRDCTEAVRDALRIRTKLASWLPGGGVDQDGVTGETG